MLGGNYSNHHGNKLTTSVKRHLAAKDHPILAGIPADEFTVASSLYKTSPLADTTTVLLTGRVAGVEQQEPVAWTNDRDGQRIFYTSLGGPQEFEQKAFRKLLKNGIEWGLDRE